MQKIALIVAGGIGERMNTTIPKQFLLLKGVPILIHVLKAFLHLDQIVLVLPKNQFNYWNRLCVQYNFNQTHTLVAGGKTRFHSVKNGLEKVEPNSIVAIHDGVRPLASTSLINRLISKAKDGTGVIPIIPIKDSIRKVDGENSTHLDRGSIYKVQTPQCFFSLNIKNAYAQGFFPHFKDDASVFEGNGGKITTILGEERNLKITTEEDLKITEVLI